MSARARLVEVVFRWESPAKSPLARRSQTTHYAHRSSKRQSRRCWACRPRRSAFVTVVMQAEVDLHFGVYERMLAEKLGVVPPIQ